MSGEGTVEYYYSSGLVGRYDGGILFGVTVNAIDDSSLGGWLRYSGATVAGVKLSDTFGDLEKKLGKPTKVEEENPLESSGELDTPVVWPAHTRYYWRRAEYTVEVGILKQAQLVSSKGAIVAPRGSMATLLVYR